MLYSLDFLPRGPNVFAPVFILFIRPTARPSTQHTLAPSVFTLLFYIIVARGRIYRVYVVRSAFRGENPGKLKYLIPYQPEKRTEIGGI